MQIYIHSNNQQLGPFTEAELKAKVTAGDISLQDHAWWEGQPGWVPLGQSSLAANLIPATPASVPATFQSLPPSKPKSPSTSAPAPAQAPATSLKKKPVTQGRSFASTGWIIGYVAIGLCLVVGVLYFIMGPALFQTITQTPGAADDQTNNAPAQATTSPSLSTNAPDQTAASPDQPATSPVPTTNAPDQTTNSPEQPAMSPAPVTNAPDQTTNSPEQPAMSPAPVTNTPDQTTNSPDQSTNSAAPATNAPDSSTTNAAPMNQ